MAQDDGVRLGTSNWGGLVFGARNRKARECYLTYGWQVAGQRCDLGLRRAYAVENGAVDDERMVLVENPDGWLRYAIRGQRSNDQECQNDESL